MKKFYTFTLCCAVCLSASADGLRFKSARGQGNMKKISLSMADAPVWRPVSQTDYMHDGESWMLLGTVSFKYDMRGNCTESLVDEEGALSKTVTTYDEFNYPLTVLQTESEDGETWTNSGKTEYVYDTKVHGFFTERISSDWTGDEWVRNYRCETNSITRNGNGNIVEVIKSLPLDDELKPAYRSEWGYGSDGKANEYRYYVNYGEDWQLYDGLSYKEIVWENTDGQMNVFGDLLELTEGNNRLKSAVVYYQDQPDGHYLAEYTEGGFLITETTNDINEIGRTTRMETLDANGSIRLTTTEYFDEEGNILKEPTYINVQEAIMDEHGNMIQFDEKETLEGETELIASTRYTYTYDESGNPTEIVTEDYDYDSMEYYPVERTVYGEYINAASGIGLIKGADTTAWTLEGDAVTASAPGLTGLSVFNIQGYRLAQTPADASSATISLADMMPGVYIIRAEGTGSTYRVLRH